VVTAAANALRAGVPVIILGGARPRALQDMGALQDLDHVPLMREVTKWSVTVPSVERIPEYIDTAFWRAAAGRPGSVFLELPLDVLMGYADDAAFPRAAPDPPPRPAGEPESISRAVDLLRRSERPVFIVGSELRWSPRRSLLRAFADAIEAPYYLSGMARGGLPCAHPNLLARTRKAALAKADLCLVLGTPLDFRLDYGRSLAPEAKLVEVALDAAELSRTRRADVAIQADSGLVLEQLLAAVKEKRSSAWVASLREPERAAQASMAAQEQAASSPPNPLRVCAELGRRLGSQDIVVGDGGDFVATAAQVLHLEHPQLWMDPGPLGTLGLGPGYGMAAKLLRPAASVVVIYGDGAFGLHAMELEAMARQGIAVVAVIGNDAAWTQIRRGQIDLYGADRAVATTLSLARYDLVADALGCVGAYVETVAQLGPALDRAFAAGKPACVNVRIAPSTLRQGAISV